MSAVRKSWFSRVCRIRSTEALELSVRQVVEHSVGEVRQRLAGRVYAMNRSQARGYIRGFARAAVRQAAFECDLASPKLLERAIDQVVARLTRERMLQPAVVPSRTAA